MGFERIAYILADVLADLYRDEVQASNLAEAAGLNIGSVVIAGAAKDRWYAILKRANFEVRVDNLLALACHGVEDYPPLKMPLQRYTEWKWCDALISLVKRAALDPDELRELVAGARPARISGAMPPISDTEALVEAVWGWMWQNENGGWLPSLVFAASLRTYLQNMPPDHLAHDPNLVEDVDVWMQGVAAFHCFSLRTASIRPNIGAGKRGTAEKESALQVILEAHAANATVNEEDALRFVPRFYLWSPQRREYLGPEQPIPPSPDGYYTLDTIGKMVRKLAIRLIEERTVRSDRLFIEFFLPVASLAVPVEHLGPQLFIGNKYPTLGDNYWVVTRPLERVANPAYWGHDAWKRRWENLRPTLAGQRPGDLLKLVSDTEYVSFEKLLSELETSADSLWLSAWFESAELLWAGIASGIPIMCWPRPPHGNKRLPDDAASEVTKILCIGCLGDLPHNVMAARLALKAKSPNCHLTLVWDDADRIPREFEQNVPALQAPTIGG